MTSHTSRSLHFRLWAVIGLACLPVFLMAFLDYREQRQAAVVGLKNEVNRMLNAVHMTQETALRSIRQTFDIMARADNLQSMDSADCSGLARRLMASMENIANIGAALPDGTLFCSALPLRAPVSVSDRPWFLNALAGTGLTAGQVLVGKVSGKAGITLGYPVRDAQNQIQAVLFTTIQMSWFDQMATQYKLPPGWSTFLLNHTGEVLSYHPRTQGTSIQRLPPEITQRFLQAQQSGAEVSELEGLDGHRRMYGLVSLRLSQDPLLVAVGAPVDRTVADIDKGFWLRIALLGAIALLSALTARFYVYGLIEAWTRKITAATHRVAAGQLQTPIAHYSPVQELQAAERGINHMADELQKRDTELRRLSAAVEQSPESIVITDTQARIQYVNTAFEHNTGYTREEVQGKNPRILNRGKTDPATYKAMWAALTSGQAWRGELINTRKDGSTYIEMAIIAPIVDAHGQVTHFVATKEDITQKKKSEEQVHRLAYYDALTSLPNRTLLKDRLQQAQQAQAASGQHSALLLVDIDRFKQINDTRGHAAGDLLLQAMGARIQTFFGAHHTVARLGSNTFGAIVQDLDAPADNADQAMEAARQRAQQLHNALATPYDLGDAKKLYAATSAGLTLLSADHPVPVETLLQQAEVAMYRAKEQGGNALLAFDASMQASIQARMAMEMGLRDAVENQAFALYYQVQEDPSGRVVGAEALIRWICAEGNVISPVDFIPLAEETGLIVPMGQWVLNTACQQLAQWQRHPATRHLSLAVNVSARQFHQADFVALVHETIDRTGIAPSGLKLELTESVILGDLETTITKMHQLRELGLRFALDDFGTGYSSLSYLKRLPFDQLKIDQSFTRDMLSDNTSGAIVRAILVMSEALGLEVIAEGVETTEQRAFLIEHGCQFYQGYLLGRPVPIATWEANHLSAPTL